MAICAQISFISIFAVSGFPTLIKNFKHSKWWLQ